jgi:hypothetical protein
MELNIIRDKNTQAFNPKNYRNSPLIREFYRFIAKNNLRAESHKLLENASKNVKSKTSYLSSITLN